MPFIGQTRTLGGKSYVYTANGWEVQSGYQGSGVGPGPWSPDDPPPTDTGPVVPTEPGQLTQPDPSNYWSKPATYPDGTPIPGGAPVRAEPGESGAWFESEAYDEAIARYQQLTGNEPGGPGGPRGPTPEQLAIERSKVATSNMANYIDAAARGLSAEIDAKRLTTEQAVGEFTRQLDAMTEARTGFLGAQQFTIPKDVEFVPGFEPEGLATSLGLQPWEASPVEYDPFGIAMEIVANTPELTSIGVPETDAVQRALELAEQFL